MTRDDILQEVLNINTKELLLELPTGTGKTKVAIEKLKQQKANNILIVVPRNVLKTSWQDEINKWWSNCNSTITYTTYISFAKYANNYDTIVFDECHHLTNRCIEYLLRFTYKNCILCSATVDKKKKAVFLNIFKDLTIYNKSLRDTIESNILPDPTVYLIPLYLDNKTESEIIIENKKGKKEKHCKYFQKFKLMQNKSSKIICHCTPQQYYKDISKKIDFYKRIYMNNRAEAIKNKWLLLCSERLKWLSNKKLKTVWKILEVTNKYRTLTFCNNIEQTELLGGYAINSKNKDSGYNLNLFNRGKIHHITTCNMLNEGANLVNCQIGIYANLNSSDTIIKQRTGRILRHKHPIIIIPYFKDTRDEELINKMLENYNKDLVKIIEDPKDIKI